MKVMGETENDLGINRTCHHSGFPRCLTRYQSQTPSEPPCPSLHHPHSSVAICWSPPSAIEESASSASTERSEAEPSCAPSEAVGSWDHALDFFPGTSSIWRNLSKGRLHGGAHTEGNMYYVKSGSRGDTADLTCRKKSHSRQTIRRLRRRSLSLSPMYAMPSITSKNCSSRPQARAASGKSSNHPSTIRASLVHGRRTEALTMTAGPVTGAFTASAGAAARETIGVAWPWTPTASEEAASS